MPMTPIVVANDSQKTGSVKYGLMAIEAGKAGGASPALRLDSSRLCQWKRVSYA